jgi:regulator of protease activity HflC (stomatin/prohibitin superfamily)
MLGLRYLKVPPTTYVQQLAGGKIQREGAGLSFFYFGPTTEIVLVPVGSTDCPFVFNEVTNDFQDATIQGQLTYRIKSPKRVAEILDFSVHSNGTYRSDDPGKLGERLTNSAQIRARAFTQRHSLRELLVKSDALVSEVFAGLQKSETVEMLGVEILDLSIISIKPSPEMARALQAEAREELLRKADEAVFTRRNAAVDQERAIKENELKTEIAVEQKKRQVRETQMAADIAVEEQKEVLIQHRVANERKEAETRAYALQTILEPLRDADWKTLMAAMGGSDPRLNIALAFRELAENAGKIGELNVSPDLLASLTRHTKGQ